MPLGTVILMIVGILIFFGLAHRVLDRMRLTDRAALVVIGLAVIGSFIDVTLLTGPAELTINLGGSLVPVALAIWLIATADHANERWRAIGGAVAAGAVLYGVSKILPREAQALPVDPIYLFAVLAGLIAYILGRSRRGAFTAAILGVTIADLAAYAELLITRTPGRAWLGGAGMIDATVIAGLVAVLIAEIVGETLELSAGGPRASRIRLREKTGKISDMSERGSDATPEVAGRSPRPARGRTGTNSQGARNRHRSEADRSTSALAPTSRSRHAQQTRPTGLVSERAELKATSGGPGSGDLDRVEAEESAGLEGSRRSPTDEAGRGARALGRRDGSESGQPGRGGDQREDR